MAGAAATERRGAQLALIAEERRARLALAEARQRGTRFFAYRVGAALNPPESTGMGFWSLNPYVGCEFGCSYCYARDTHRYAVERAGHDSGLAPWLAFEREILVKANVAEVLRRTLAPAKLGQAELVIGTATDPYQPAERTFRRTRAVLEALCAWRGLRIGIISKSPLIARDADLLAELHRRHALRIHVSLATVDAPLARRLEPRSPHPAARLRSLARLRAAGLDAGLLVAPIIPLLTDGEAALDALFAAARAAGATRIVGLPLRLGEAARQRFLPHLAAEFPGLIARYERHFGRATATSRRYREALGARLRALQAKHGFPVRGELAGSRGGASPETPSPGAEAGAQLELGWG